jgi:AcrR family transcriptional regulator
MPAIAKTSRDEIINVALLILEEDGEAAVTMQSVAKRVGIRGPSLYKWFPDRKALLLALEEIAFRLLGDGLRQAEGRIDRMAYAYLSFAREHPALHGLIFRSGPSEQAAECVRPALEAFEKLLGNPADALVRTRVFASFLYGFSLMEQAGAFRLQGDPADTLPVGIKLLVPEAF